MAVIVSDRSSHDERPVLKFIVIGLVFIYSYWGVVLCAQNFRLQSFAEILYLHTTECLYISTYPAMFISALELSSAIYPALLRCG